MVNFPGRNGRRRRVLNDEMLSTSTVRVVHRAPDEDEVTYAAPRYSDAAGVEHHPQITDFVPRRYRSIAVLLMFGIAISAAFAGLHYMAPAIATVANSDSLPAFDLASPGNLSTWVASVVLLLTSALCLMIYSLRRHRIDDFRGRYRVWLAASIACLFLGANSVASLHQVLTHTLSHATGWTTLRDGSVWWIAVFGVPAGWLAIRTLLDISECRLATTFFVAAIAAYTASLACYLAMVPAGQPQLNVLLHSSLTLLGHWLLLATATSYARYVVLDAQGLIPLRPKSRRSKAANGAEHETVPAIVRRGADSKKVSAPASPAVSAEADREWVDGSRPEREPYEDGDEELSGARKLSKSDRKKLRKLKAQNRAA